MVYSMIIILSNKSLNTYLYRYNRPRIKYEEVTSNQAIGDHHHGNAFAEGWEHEGDSCDKGPRHAHSSTPVLVA